MLQAACADDLSKTFFINIGTKHDVALDAATLNPGLLGYWRYASVTLPLRSFLSRITAHTPKAKSPPSASFPPGTILVSPMILVSRVDFPVPTLPTTQTRLPVSQLGRADPSRPTYHAGS